MTEPIIHVERASFEDLPEIWRVDEEHTSGDTRRQALLHAVEQKQCTVAKIGWDVVGYAVRQPWFFDDSIIMLLNTQADAAYATVAAKLLVYMERTTPQKRLFAAVNAANTDALTLYEASGYRTCGEITHLAPNNQPTHIYLKMLG